MKIIQLVTRNCIGGVQVVAQILDEGFRRAGHESSIWFFCDTENEAKTVDHSWSVFSARPKRFYYPLLMARLFFRLRQEKPDAVIAHTTNTAVPGLFLAKLAGVQKRVAVQHNPLNSYTAAARYADRICANMGVYWRNVTVANAVSQTMTDYSRKATARVRTIYNGMEQRGTVTVSLPDERAGLRRKFNLPSDRPLVVAIGRLAEQKNHRVLVEAMQSLPGIVLAIAGDGPLRDQLQSQIVAAGVSDRVLMLGLLDQAGVRSLIRASDVFVTTSHFEAMPMVVLEAMCEGAAIVASDIGAHRELLGPDGFLVAADADSISNAVRRLITEEPMLREQLASHAIERARLFSDQAMTEAYINLLEDDR